MTRWYDEIFRGRRSPTNESRVGHPKSVVVSKNIEADWIRIRS